MSKKTYLVLPLILIGIGSTLVWTIPSEAHPGRTDARGCHTDRRTGQYHCHSGGSSGGSGTSTQPSSSTISPRSPVESVQYRICTRDPGSRVTLREGAGTNHSRGLVEVGSGGAAVYNWFQQQNFTAQDDTEVSVFSSAQSLDRQMWYLVGDNQWTAWVRADFVCPSPRL